VLRRGERAMTSFKDDCCDIQKKRRLAIDQLTKLSKESKGGNVINILVVNNVISKNFDRNESIMAVVKELQEKKSNELVCVLYCGSAIKEIVPPVKLKENLVDLVGKVIDTDYDYYNSFSESDIVKYIQGSERYNMYLGMNFIFVKK